MNIIVIGISPVYRQVSPLIIIQYLKDLGGGTGLFDLGHATYLKTVRETTHTVARQLCITSLLFTVGKMAALWTSQEF